MDKHRFFSLSPLSFLVYFRGQAAQVSNEPPCRRLGQSGAAVPAQAGVLRLLLKAVFGIYFPSGKMLLKRLSPGAMQLGNRCQGSIEPAELRSAALCYSGVVISRSRFASFG